MFSLVTEGMSRWLLDFACSGLRSCYDESTVRNLFERRGQLLEDSDEMAHVAVASFRWPPSAGSSARRAQRFTLRV